MKNPVARLTAAIAIAFICSCSKSATTAPIIKIDRAKTDIEAIATQLKLYQATNGFLPTTAQGLNALVTNPTTDPKPTHWVQFFPNVPLDPWGNPYLYKIPGTHNPGGYDLYSAGPDGKPGTGDDIGNW